MQLYTNSVQDRYGNALKGAQITVRTAAGALATLYADNGATPATNPLIADASGEFRFYAANGRYTFTVSAQGLQSETVDAFELQDALELRASLIADAGVVVQATQSAINNRYRGALAADPATRLDGSANVTGDEYFSTAANLLKRWNGAAWQASDISTANLANPDGAALMGFRPVGAGVTPTTAERKLGENISVFAFMTSAQIASVQGWGAVDVTAPVQAAVNYWIAQGVLGRTVCLKFPYGKYLVSTITISNPAYTLSIDIDGAEFVGTSATIKYGIFDVIDANVLNVTGSHVLNGGNSANYAALWSLRSVAGGGLARVNIYNPTIRATQVGFWIGDSAIGLKCSEINVFGANFSQCPIPVYLGGSQSGAQFHGCNIVSEPNAAFPASPQRAIWMEGGFIKVSGGSIVANPTANQTLFLNPSNDSYGNTYPGLSICGVHVESNSGVLATISNPRGLAAPISNTSSLIVNGCAGYSGGGGAVGDFVSVTDGTYAGTIDVKSNNFYASSARSSANMSSTSALTKFVTDKTSFGKNFLNWLGGINGGKVIHDLLPCANATGLGAQVIAAGGSGILKFQALNVVGDLSKYGGGYNPTTGLYTVPQGGFEFLNVSVGLQWTGCTNAFFGLRKNGIFVAYGNLGMGGAGGGLQATLYKLVVGDTLDVFFYAYTVAATFDNAATQALHMQAATSL